MTEAVEALASAKSIEEVVEIITSLVADLADLWLGGATVSTDAMDEMVKLEEEIKEKNGGAIVDVVNGEGFVSPVTGIENALLSVPKGGDLKVEAADLNVVEKEKAKELGVTDEQLSGAVVFGMTLVDDENKETELKAPVRISFNVPAEMKGKELMLVHYGADGTELLDVEENGDTASAIVTGFSEFALIAVDNAAPAPTNTPASSGSGTGTDSVVDTVISTLAPKMGDNALSVIVLVVIGMACVALAFAGATILRKKEEE